MATKVRWVVTLDCDDCVCFKIGRKRCLREKGGGMTEYIG